MIDLPLHPQPPHQQPRTFVDPERLAEHVERENNALASMQAAQERRVDQLVTDVGTIKRDLGHLEGNTGRISESMADLANALKLLMKHDLQMTHDRDILEHARRDIAELNARLVRIELVMPGLIERSRWVTNGLLFVVGAVGVALLSLVVIRGQ